MPRSYTTVFFDLDGTLLPMDTHDFMERYFKSLGAFAAQQGLDPEICLGAVMAGVKAMAKTDGSENNHDVFWEAFTKVTGLDAESTEALFAKYYAGPFSQVGEGIAPSHDAARAVAALKAKGYRMAVTTMPMFPLPAVNERIRWAGLNPADFEFATDYETCNAVKPMPRYYEGCLARAGVTADEVLMVGNHNREDGLATKLGCDIYFVTDHLIESEEGLNVSEHKHGSMKEFADWCEGLPTVAE